MLYIEGCRISKKDHIFPPCLEIMRDREIRQSWKCQRCMAVATNWLPLYPQLMCQVTLSRKALHQKAENWLDSASRWEVATIHHASFSQPSSQKYYSPFLGNSKRNSKTLKLLPPQISALKNKKKIHSPSFWKQEE